MKQHFYCLYFKYKGSFYFKIIMSLAFLLIYNDLQLFSFISDSTFQLLNIFLLSCAALSYTCHVTW